MYIEMDNVFQHYLYFIQPEKSVIRPISVFEFETDKVSLLSFITGKEAS